jgi:hypothetical protein
MADEKQNTIVHVHYVHHIYHPAGAVVPGVAHADTLMVAPGFYPQPPAQTQAQPETPAKTPAKTKEDSSNGGDA